MFYGLVGFFAQEHIEQRGENIAQATSEAPQPPPELLFHVGPLAITNTIVTAWVVIIILVLFAWLSTRKMKDLPSGAQNLWELIIELWSGVATNTMGPRRARRFLPLVATAFLFILFSNWFGT